MAWARAVTHSRHATVMGSRASPSFQKFRPTGTVPALPLASPPLGAGHSSKPPFMHLQNGDSDHAYHIRWLQEVHLKYMKSVKTIKVAQASLSL